MHLLRSAFVLALFFLARVAHAQGEAQRNVMVYGHVRDRYTGERMPAAAVIVSANGLLDRSVKADSVGGYELFLEMDHPFRLRYEAPGYVAKYIAIDTRGIPVEEQEGGFGMNVDMTLFRFLDGVDVSFLNEPIGIARYVPADTAMVWDTLVTARMKEQVRIALLQADSLLAERAVKAATDRARTEENRSYLRSIGTIVGVLTLVLLLLAVARFKRKRRAHG